MASTQGLFALPFMRRALERKKLEASSAATAALAEIAAEEMAAEGRKTETPLVGGHAGRISFGRAKQGTKSAAVALPFDGVGYGDSLEYNSDGSSAEEGEGKGEKDEEQEREGTPGPLPPSNPEELKSAERLSASSGRLTLPVSEGEQKTAERKQLTSAKAKQKGEDGGVRPHARAFDAKPRPSAAPAKPAKDQGEAISDFVPAGKFCGSKQGYAFKAGAKVLPPTPPSCRGRGFLVFCRQFVSLPRNPRSATTGF